MSELIAYTLKLKNEYNSNINTLINNGEHNIRIEYIEENKSVYAYNFKIYDTFYIFLNPSVVNENNKDFVIAHELAHVLLHDENLRIFSNLGLKTDKFETQANLFATYFLGYEYRDCNNDNEIQKVINYIHCNFKLCDLAKTI
ncbi:ImmA/IrrE family metallo-endopeptidase [uncultured Sneathia sp.]|uniref:ImmA/IrrE family metallo-endopeptidase n=1 Tax=uncultured Sneathia sp. TaxID=278067 RepID=UPI0025922958|nr:ImmA/IrrE family metallo-endopeptidase [uncultured Sneathia sp.]